MRPAIHLLAVTGLLILAGCTNSDPQHAAPYDAARDYYVPSPETQQQTYTSPYSDAPAPADPATPPPSASPPLSMYMREIETNRLDYFYAAVGNHQKAILLFAHPTATFVDYSVEELERDDTHLAFLDIIVWSPTKNCPSPTGTTSLKFELTLDEADTLHKKVSVASETCADWAAFEFVNMSKNIGATVFSAYALRGLKLLGVSATLADHFFDAQDVMLYGLDWLSYPPNGDAPGS